MKRKMRGIVDPYGIGLVLAFIGAFFFEAQQDELQQARQQEEYNQSIANTNQIITEETTDASDK